MKAYPLGILLACTLTMPIASAAIVWDEGVHGDLSGDFANPTGLNFAPGANTVVGTTGRASSTAPSERDYFTFTVPNGYLLVSIVLVNAGFERPDGAGFFALQSGTSVVDPTTVPFGDLAAPLLGYTHYSTALIGTDLFPVMGASGPPTVPAAIGFTAIGPGTYSGWIQDTGVGTLPYEIEFTLATPEPGTWATGLVGLSALAFFRRKR